MTLFHRTESHPIGTHLQASASSTGTSLRWRLTDSLPFSLHRQIWHNLITHYLERRGRKPRICLSSPANSTTLGYIRGDCVTRRSQGRQYVKLQPQPPWMRDSMNQHDAERAACLCLVEIAQLAPLEQGQEKTENSFQSKGLMYVVWEEPEAD